MIAEAFVGQELLSYSQTFRKSHLYFWRRAEKSSKGEIDYIYEHQQSILPIEVKSGAGGTLKSLHAFLEKRPDIPYGYRFSKLNYSIHDRLISKPLYAVASLAHPDEREALNYLY
jgi:predicted AAA+ superfamily ATPase